MNQFSAIANHYIIATPLTQLNMYMYSHFSPLITSDSVMPIVHYIFKRAVKQVYLISVSR